MFSYNSQLLREGDVTYVIKIIVAIILIACQHQWIRLSLDIFFFWGLFWMTYRTWDHNRYFAVELRSN